MVIGALLIALAGGVWLRLRSLAPSVPTQSQVMAAVMARADDDHDDRLSRGEWTRYGGEDAVFDRYDVDHDGFLTLDEFTTLFLATDPMRMDGR